MIDISHILVLSQADFTRRRVRSLFDVPDAEVSMPTRLRRRLRLR
ncbi:MAG TPA: hypothetical protein VF704_05235 [Allosphingosinicella sp.]|jgi:hypothetical protein